MRADKHHLDVQKPLLKGQVNQVDAVLCLEFVDQVLAVGFHGVDADA